METLTDIASARLDDVAAEGLDGEPVDPAALEQARTVARPGGGGEWAGPEGPERDARVAQWVAIQQAVAADQRDALLDLRSQGRYDSDVLSDVLGRLDLMSSFRGAVTSSPRPRRSRRRR